MKLPQLMPDLLRPSIGGVSFARLLKSKTPTSVKIIVVVWQQSYCATPPPRGARSRSEA
jgi:hypothetical protein